jgi:hypothetical protein
MLFEAKGGACPDLCRSHPALRRRDYQQVKRDPSRPAVGVEQLNTFFST